MLTPDHIELARFSGPARASGPSDQRDLRAEMRQHFVELADGLGLPRSYGEIYGVLYASPSPLSFTDVVRETGLSKGSISQGLQVLRGVGAIKPSLGPDTRREYFVPELELRQLISGLLGKLIKAPLETGAVRVERLRGRHRARLAASDHTSRVLATRLDKLQSWHRRGAGLAAIVAKIFG